MPVAKGEVPPPIKRHGGKFYLAKMIIPHIPPHTHYVEPYFGGGAVLLQKNPENVSEVINDIDGELMSFWRALQSDELFEKLKRRLEATPFSQEVFEEALANAHEPTADPIERAARFFILARQSRQGVGRVFATLSRTRTRRAMNEQASSWLTAIEGLPEVHARLRRVVILNDDAVRVIRQQDDTATFFYCDPPYVHATRSLPKAYKCEMTDAQHEELLAALASIKGKFILSGYHCDMYDAWAVKNGYRCVEIEIDNKASGSKVKEIKIECLWMNFPAEKEEKWALGR
jgi:DNA adenine methylase